MTIDLRSDTVTRPTPAMREAMFAAPVGDDVMGEDASVQALQEKAAAMFGMEAALFCPSGTMTNQIAIQLHTSPLSEVICDEGAHVYVYEVGGIAHHARASARVLRGDRGRLNAQQIREAVNEDDPHLPATRLVCLENTSNRGGGACYDWAEIQRIRQVCTAHGLALHLDGARLFNALVATGQKPQAYGQVFDSISICLSKGLGAPVGSLLLGKRAWLKNAVRVRKAMGGGMRQAGFLAAAGSYALDHHVERLAEDHRRARALGQALEGLPYVARLLPVETNIVLFELKVGVSRARFTEHMTAQGVLLGGYSSGAERVRLVTHLDVTDEQIERVVASLRGFIS